MCSLNGVQSRSRNEWRKVKSINWVFLCFQRPQQLHKDRGEDGREETSLSVCSSLYQCFYGDKARGWDRWRRCHGDRQGVRACVCMHVNECVRLCASVHVTLLDQGLRRACRLLKLSVLLWPLSLYRLWQREGEVVRESERQEVKGQETDKERQGRHQENYYLLQRKIKTPSKNQCLIFPRNMRSCSFHPPLILFLRRHLGQPEPVWSNMVWVEDNGGAIHHFKVGRF